MIRLERARDAAVEAVAAATLVGLVEGLRVGMPAGAAGIAAITGAAWLSAIAFALVLRAGLAVVVRLPPIDRWMVAARDDATRSRAAWSAVLLALSAGALAFGAFRVFGWAHREYRFNDADAIGAAVAGIDLALAAAIALVALGIDRIVRPRLPAIAAAPATAIGLVALAVVPPLVLRRAVPDLDIAPYALISLTAALVIAAPHAALPRFARWAAPAIVVAGLAGTWSLGSLPRARLAIVEHGVPSKWTAQLVWRFADHDGDGFPGAAVGGADCDDADPTRHPGAIDVAGNGKDENCSGADATSRLQPAIAGHGDQRPTIVLISVDALRADRLGAYGYRRRTPALDALAARGVRFASAFTSCPSTRCAIPALHSGRYHPADSTPTLAAALHDRGYATAAITCCDRFSGASDRLAGFDHIDASADGVRLQRAGQSNAAAVVDRALAWLARPSAAPRFLWVHLYEPHSPYEAPAGPDLGDSDSDRYDREVAFADAQIGRLVAAVPDAVVVVTADHGEELGEHGIRFHARSLYNQVIRIPLVIAGPAIAPRVIDTPVSLVDVMPTLAELGGAAIPRGVAGVSLAGALHGAAAPARPVVVELPHDRQIKRDMAAVIVPPYKVIWDREANAWQRFAIDDGADEHELADDPALHHLLLDALDLVH
jgi:hypothetical protein